MVPGTLQNTPAATSLLRGALPLLPRIPASVGTKYIIGTVQKRPSNAASLLSFLPLNGMLCKRLSPYNFTSFPL